MRDWSRCFSCALCAVCLGEDKVVIMCQVCSPMCGNCKPASYKPVLCSSCGKATLFTREECLLHLKRPHRATALEKSLLEKASKEKREFGKPLCRNCGAPILEDMEALVKPRRCNYSRILCGYPCGRGRTLRQEGAPACDTQVPLGRWED